MTIDTANLFAPIGGESTIAAGTGPEQFETLLRRAGCRVERIVSHGQVTPEGKWYDQNWDEWVAVIDGEAELEFAESPQRLRLRRGDYLLIPAGQRHRVSWTSGDRATVWLAIHLH